MLNSVREYKLSLGDILILGRIYLARGEYTQLGITDSAREVKLCRGNLNPDGELCYLLFVGEINHVGEINPVDEYLMNF